MRKISIRNSRIIAGVFLAVIAFTAANYYLSWGVFGGLDKIAMVLSIALSGLFVLVWEPTTDELREYRDRKRNESQTDEK